jgi:hypothetical protein
MEANIRIRIGSANNGDYETKTYINSTFAEAVAALQGEHAVGVAISDTDTAAHYHRRVSVYVVATYLADHDEYHGPKRTIARHADEPIFGFEVTVYGRDLAFGEPRDAEVSRGSMGGMTTDQTRMLIDLETLALNLALAANAEPFCPACRPELDRYAERKARLAAE